MARGADELSNDIQIRERQASRLLPSPLQIDVDDAGDGRPSPVERKASGPSAALPPPLLGLITTFLLVLPTLTFLLRGYGRWIPSVADCHAPVSSSRRSRFRGSFPAQEPNTEEKEPIYSVGSNVKLLGGLLSSDFDEGYCSSRYQSVMYRKPSHYKPSSYLINMLRDYEALHRKCGPGSELYNKTVNQLNTGQDESKTECKYILWIAHGGLGNRMMVLASSFLYALLTGRVLLVQRTAEMEDLFCEPFPNETWLLPLDFPLQPIHKFNKESPEAYGSMLKNGVLDSNAGNNSTISLPTAYVYVHLLYDYDGRDRQFFCDHDQYVLDKFAWMIVRSDNYFVPSLFLIPKFDEQLSHLFPEKDTVFHHLGRYLFHPTNSVWGLITRYYQAYLAKADETVGIQIRVFKGQETEPLHRVLNQILDCTSTEKLLPQVDFKVSTSSNVTGKRKVVLLTSLNFNYYEKIRTLYWENPTSTGEIVSVYQPSYEEKQQTRKQTHNMKAWSEIYLLSLSDILVTTARSTFGYAAQSLGGLRPWILLSPDSKTVPNPPCRLAMSMEPCFHAAPSHQCNSRGQDTGAVVPYVQHCEDVTLGLKLVNRDVR